MVKEMRKTMQVWCGSEVLSRPPEHPRNGGLGGMGKEGGAVGKRKNAVEK